LSPDSARTRWRSLERSPDPLAAFDGLTKRGEEMGGEEGERRCYAPSMEIA